ncbi:uncharacterized protein LOC141501859 [Macrotis lagotis]|uniref:uncharacterized protein LOC141501859 n=1 Tax=Macrotis lagotis TaxID=92651 RepID=UPI003D69FAC0
MLADIQLLSKLTSSPRRKKKNFGGENRVSRNQSYQKKQECQEKILTEQLMQNLPESSPAVLSSWSPDEDSLPKPAQEQDQQDDFKILENQHPLQKEGISQEIGVTEEESHHLGLDEVGIERCYEGSMSPENPHDSRGSSGTDPQVYDIEDLKTQQQGQDKGQSRGLLRLLEEEIIKVTRSWQEWEVNEVVKVMQEQHRSQIEEMQKVIHQQWTEEKVLFQHGSQNKLGSLVKPQEIQDHEHSLGKWDPCQKKGGVLSLPPQQDGKLFEIVSTEVQLGRGDQKTVQHQRPVKGWPEQEDEVSELSKKEGQKSDEPKVVHLEQQKENIANLTGISQVLQVVKEHHHCQKEAILKVMYQQQTHQEEAIRKVIDQQCQVEMVLKVMKQEWQHQMEAILKTVKLQQESQEKAILKVIRQLECQGKEDPKMMEPDQNDYEKEEMKHESKSQNTEESQDLDRKSITLKERVGRRRRPKHSQNSVSNKREQLIQDTVDQRQELCEEENDNKVVEQNQEEEKKSKKPKRDTPNYFVAIPVTNDQILDKIEDVQEFIYNKEPELLKALIPVQTMHITIITAHLKTEQDVQRAVSALEQSKVYVVELLEGKRLNMTFHGIGQFSNQVIYVKMSGEQEQQLLSRIAEVVEKSFQEMNIDITGSKDFRPHLTFLKLSKVPSLRRKGFRKIYPKLYKEYEDCPFGTEVFSQIDLCSMHKKKQESGYYHCECTISVAPGGIEEPQKLPTEKEHLEELGSHISPDSCLQVKTTEYCHCISCVAEDDEKPIEGITSTGAECEIAVHETDVLVSEDISTIDEKVCIEPFPEILPAQPDAMKNIDEGSGKKKMKLTDGNL